MNFCRRLATAFTILLALALSTTGVSAKKVEIIISKISQKMTVKVDGDTTYVWAVSTGAARYDTPTGAFRPNRMVVDHFSKEWDNAPMPNSIFFTERGHAIHGSFDVKNLGRRASKGCVRLSPENARTLYALVGDTGMSNTSVVIKGGLFDFSGSGKRSFSQVSNDIDKTAKKKPYRGFFWSLNQPRNQKPDVLAAKKANVQPKKVAAAKSGDKSKKTAPVEASKSDAKVKKVAEKCVAKDGKKKCSKVPAVKAASAG